MNIVIVGIHTGIGKTLCSALLCEVLGYDYWKPVQAGNLEKSDTIFVASHITHNKCQMHSEAYKLTTATSPHYAAQIDKVSITHDRLTIPPSHNSIIIETAGGLMSPLGNNFLNIDLVIQFKTPVILVSNNYLGSINHTLLSIHLLKSYGIDIKGIVYSGKEHLPSTSFIASHTQIPKLFHIPYMPTIEKKTIKQMANHLAQHINGLVA